MPATDSFDAFYRDARSRVAVHLYAITGDVVEAQDVTQEAFARAWQRWDQVRRYENPEAWVRIVGRRLAINRWRRTKSRMAAYSRHGLDAHALPPSEDNVAIVAALRQLPYEQRVAIVLHHLAGLSVVDVARELEIPVGTVKARLWRGRRALAPLLATEDQLPATNEQAAIEAPAVWATEAPEDPDATTARGGER
jgi:RNA polymerase sigma-70 factor (ECF subfamily)